MTRYRTAYQDLNSLTTRSDVNFISAYRMSIQSIESSLDLKDKSLLRPLLNREIPFCMSNIEKQLQNLGAVGGGVMPIELGAATSGPQGTLMQLYWQLPEGCGRLHRFQIEYEQVFESSIERRGSGLVEADGEKDNEPQYYEVPGNELIAFVDYLCLGFTYRFRIRSANDAGFGMWSDPIVAQSIGFPFTLEYTKKIHRIIIPSFGSYRITVKGAKAADGLMHKGGKGAIISAVVSLKAGDVLILLCGGMSSRHHYHSGGGGASFVSLNEISPESLLIAAGGGGGTRGADANDFDGSDASLYEDGLDGQGNYFGAGGKIGGPGGDADDGSNGEEPWSWGGGGAGFMQDSTTAQGFVAGGHGGQNGGFGGGGSVGMYGGGGGGGFSGGGGGRGGGGGGSYVISTAMEVKRTVGNEGHGSIVIEKVVPPYPISNSFQRVSTDGGISTGSSSSIANLESQLSSSSFSRAVTTSSNGSNGQMGNIQEDPELLQQTSPSSTEQVEPDNHPVFTIEGNPHLVQEEFTIIPSLMTGHGNAPAGIYSQTKTSGPGPSQQYPAAVSSVMKPAQSAQNIGDGVQQQWPMHQHSVPYLPNPEKVPDEIPQRRHNTSPPMTQQRPHLDPSVSSVTVQLQQQQQQQQQPQQQQQQQQILETQLQPMQQQQLLGQHVSVSQLRPATTTTSPPTTTVQPSNVSVDPGQQRPVDPVIMGQQGFTQPPGYHQ
jgi:hypothetical protein